MNGPDRAGGSMDSSIFGDPPDGFENWIHGPLEGCILVTESEDVLAGFYKRAGDALVEVALRSELPLMYSKPILSLYRLTLELYLKEISNTEKRGHDLKELLRKVDDLVSGQIGQEVPTWVRNVVLKLHDLDRYARSFHYTRDRFGKKMQPLPGYLVEFSLLKAGMEVICQSLHRILEKIRPPAFVQVACEPAP
ncbi:MAG: hypothetical protein HY650_13875 [Acidobacteria bacterium]|nr:hypothetical protein [Acidobacteriota bacterium]